MTELLSPAAVLLGFDLRVRPRGASAFWETQRQREDFLLRPEVPFPISADDHVWPQAVWEHEGALGKFVWPEVRWGSYEEAITARERLRLKDAAVVVAFSARLLVSDLPLARRFSMNGLPDSLCVAGFDVLTFDCYSVLMNCGFASESMAALRMKYGATLNNHHLFIREEDALAYAEEMRCLMNRNHMPIYVISVYAELEG